jgi:hypothetical protein
MSTSSFYRPVLTRDHTRLMEAEFKARMKGIRCMEARKNEEVDIRGRHE